MFATAARAAQKKTSRMFRDKRKLIKSAAWLVLLVMLTLLVGQSAHIYSHSRHEAAHGVGLVCEAGHEVGNAAADGASEATSEGSSDETSRHDCAICNFALSLFTRIEPLLIAGLVTVLASIFTRYIQSEDFLTILERNSRAPPQAIA